MTTTFAAALLAQAVSLALLRHRLGRRWLRRPVTLFMLVSTVDLGIAPALLTIDSVRADDTFALGVNRGFTDSADLVMSVVMLGFTLAYLLTRPERTVTMTRPDDALVVARVLDWRVLAVACLAMAVVTAAGRGYSDGTAAGVGTPVETDLVSTFFIIVIAVTSVAFVLRHGSRWFLPVLVVQSILLALAGERTPVLMDAVALIIAARFVGSRPSRRQLGIAALLAIVTVYAISGVRAEQGRTIFYSNSGLMSRVTALGNGLVGGGLVGGGPDGGGPEAGYAASPGLVAQFATRESGVDFAGAILQSMSEGQPRLSPRYVPESLLLIVPSFLWTSKLDRSLALNPAQLQINDFGLQQINYIPGMVGTYIGMLSVPELMIFFGLVGLTFGGFERWLLRECTPVRVILLVGGIVSALWYEAGLPTMLIQMRAAVALAVAAKVAERLMHGRVSLPDPRWTLASPRRNSSAALSITENEGLN